MVCLGCGCPDATTSEQLHGLGATCWSLSDPGISRTAPNLQPELGKYSVWSTGLNSGHPQCLEQKITLWWLPGTEARSWKENIGNGCKGRHKVAGQENKQTAKRASQGEVNKIDLKYI